MHTKQLTTEEQFITYKGIFALRKSPAPVKGQMSKVNRSTSKGFTLVEALIAIAILITAVVGPISLIGDATHRLYYSRDRLIALNLAQEGIEVVRQKRDSNMLGGVAWDLGISADYYTISATSSTPIVPTGGLTTPQTVFMDSYGFYTQNGGTVTQFKRIVNTTGGGATPELKASSTVTWTTGGQAGTVTVSEYLFKWAVP